MAKKMLTIPATTAATKQVANPAPKATANRMAPKKSAPVVVDEEEDDDEVPSKAGKFAGIGTMVKFGIPAGLRRNEFQDRLLELNEQKNMHKSDEELAAIMDAEHPEGGVRIAERLSLVAAIRRVYNAGRHGKQQQGVPTVQSRRYIDGKPAEVTTTREPKAKSA